MSLKSGSAWVGDLASPASSNQIHIAQITRVEVIAALARRRRQGSISAAATAIAIADFRFDLRIRYYVIDTNLIAAAMELAEKHGLRGYDAVQVAGVLGLRTQCDALQLPDPSLVSADLELNNAASAEGLAVDNPNSHA